MISENAKKGLHHIFIQAARINLLMDPADTIAIDALADGPLVETPEKQIVVLTLASYRFRLLVLFHVGGDHASQDYFTRSEPGRLFAEAIGEIGNLCCGAMNRDLGRYFLHTGMSTPYLLESQCVPFIDELRPSHVAQYKIVINDAVFMHASLCLCAYAAIDFHVDPEIALQATGELELF